MTERKQLTDEMVRQFREGCALLAAMSEHEYAEGESDRYYQFCDLDKNLTWRLIGPHSCSVFSADLDGPCYLRPELAQAVDWPVAQTWRKALIEATGITPRNL
jgi:hypothetical protein